MPESSTRTVERAMTLLAAVCKRGHCSLAEAAREAELPVSTALRLLRTLEAQDFLNRDDDGGYHPGPRLIQLGAKAFSREMLITLSRPAMDGIAAATRESVYLAVPGPAETALYVSIVEGSYSVRHTNWVGRTVPLQGSAAGEVMRGHTPDTGYVVMENTVEDDVTAICSPILRADEVIATLSTLVPSYRLDAAKRELCGKELVSAARQISAALGTTSG